MGKEVHNDKFHGWWARAHGAGVKGELEQQETFPPNVFPNYLLLGREPSHRANFVEELTQCSDHSRQAKTHTDEKKKKEKENERRGKTEMYKNPACWKIHRPATENLGATMD